MGQFILTGDVSALSQDGRAKFLVALARHVGIDPLERPFMLMRDGKTKIAGQKNKVDKWVVYATAACSSALCRERSLSTDIISLGEETFAGQELIVCKMRCTQEAGRGKGTGERHTEAVGAVPVQQPEVEWQEDRGKRFKVVTGWRMPTPDEAANLLMKSSTKAERRAILRCVGLGGILDESEIETVDPANNGAHFGIDVEEPASDETQVTPAEPDPPGSP
jgi:hypothetical protein